MGWFLLTRWRPEVLPRDCPPKRTPPPPRPRDKTKYKTVNNVARTGSTDRHTNSVASTHPDGMAGCGGCFGGGGEEGNSSAALSTLALQATPLWAGVRQCLLVITHFTRGWGGRRLHGWAWKGPEDKSKRAGGSFPGWTSAVDVGAATFTHGQCMARSHLNHAEWRGGWGCGVQARDQILNSTRSGWDSR